jgi:hypothetical protein
MINLNVKYLSDAYIASVADSFLKENSVESIPVNIERIIEFNYRMDIVPVPSLQAAFDIEGCSAFDFSAIFVDQYVYEQRYNRYRFTLAHELAHKVLHQEYYKKMEFFSISEWANVVEQIDENDRSKMEYQAYAFAGLILVPPKFLRTEFEEQLHLFKPQIEQAQSNDISRDDYLNTVVDGIAYILSTKFKVSTGVLSRRIKNDCLEQEIG